MMRELAAVTGLLLALGLGCTEVVEPQPVPEPFPQGAVDRGPLTDAGRGCETAGLCDPYDPGPACACQGLDGAVPEEDGGPAVDGGDPYAR